MPIHDSPRKVDFESRIDSKNRESCLPWSTTLPSADDDDAVRRIKNATTLSVRRTKTPHYCSQRCQTLGGVETPDRNLHEHSYAYAPPSPLPHKSFVDLIMWPKERERRGVRTKRRVTLSRQRPREFWVSQQQPGLGRRGRVKEGRKDKWKARPAAK